MFIFFMNTECLSVLGIKAQEYFGYQGTRNTWGIRALRILGVSGHQEYLGYQGTMSTSGIRAIRILGVSGHQEYLGYQGTRST